MIEDNNDGFGAAPASLATVTTPATGAFVPTAGAVRSNHNSHHETNPVLTANLEGKPDYNPMRMTPNRANDASDVTMIPESAAAIVGMKGDRPTAADDSLAGRDMAGNEDASKVARDTIVTDPVTRITTRANTTTVADDLASDDRAARDAETVA